MKRSLAIFSFYEDIPSVTRASFMIFALVMIGGWGFSKAVYALRQSGRLILLVLFGAVVLGEIVFFSHEYINHQKFYKGVFRDEGMVQEVEYINSAKDKYDLVLVPYGANSPFYFLFYNDIFDSNIRIDLADLSQGFRRGNVIFNREFCNSHRFDQFKNQKVLFINDENCEEKPGNKRVYELKRSDGTVVFRAYEQAGN